MNTTTSTTASAHDETAAFAARRFATTMVDALESNTTADYPWRSAALGGIAETVYKAAKKAGHSKQDADELRRVVFFVGDDPSVAEGLLVWDFSGGDQFRMTPLAVLQLLEEMERKDAL